MFRCIKFSQIWHTRATINNVRSDVRYGLIFLSPAILHILFSSSFFLSLLIWRRIMKTIGNLFFYQYNKNLISFSLPARCLHSIRTDTFDNDKWRQTWSFLHFQFDNDAACLLDDDDGERRKRKHPGEIVSKKMKRNESTHKKEIDDKVLFVIFFLTHFVVVPFPLSFFWAFSFSSAAALNHLSAS